MMAPAIAGFMVIPLVREWKVFHPMYRKKSEKSTSGCIFHPGRVRRDEVPVSGGKAELRMRKLYR
jgi:hypothetical protein